MNNGDTSVLIENIRHCLCNALYVYCLGRAVTTVGKTCGPTPCFILAINTFKLTNTLANSVDPDDFMTHKVLHCLLR